MPVDVVLGDVQHHGRVGAHRLGPVQLEARELDDDDLGRLLGGDDLDERRADVARDRDARSPPARSIAPSMPTVVVLPLVPVTTSHGAGSLGRTQPPGELDLAPDRDAALAARGDQQRCVGSPAGRGDDQRGAVGQRLAVAEPDADAVRLRVRPREPARARRSAPSTTVTSAPRAASARAAAAPETPSAGDTTAAGPVGTAVEPAVEPRDSREVTRAATRRRTDRGPRPMLSAAMIQNRMTMVSSSQPSSSKWCWSGAMRKIRLPVSLNDATCMITDSVMTTNRPPMSRSSSSVRLRTASPAMPPPRASDPVSPMKILAGGAFHHRKPMHAPISAAATTARSSGSRVA